jgi:hypothetical protein
MTIHSKHSHGKVFCYTITPHLNGGGLDPTSDEVYVIRLFYFYAVNGLSYLSKGRFDGYFFS